MDAVDAAVVVAAEGVATVVTGVEAVDRGLRATRDRAAAVME